MVEPGERDDTTDLPGASRSGLASLSAAVGPTPEKAARESSLLLTVVWSSEAPTVITIGSSAGLAIVPAALPWLPEATTTTMPEFHTRSTAKSSGSAL